ncbi:MAG: TauD/TfdA family dioxygenase [Hoeflea sp. D1-CHI-28]
MPVFKNNCQKTCASCLKYTTALSPAVDEIEVNAECRDAITDFIVRSDAKALDEAPTDTAMHAARLIQENADQSVLNELDRFSMRDADALILRGAFKVPDDLPPSPREGQEDIVSRCQAIASMAYGQAAGFKPVSCDNENGGLIDRSVVAKKGLEASRGSHGKGGLHDHTEHAQAGFYGHSSPDGVIRSSASVDALIIAMLRNPTDDPTTVVCLPDVSDLLPEHIVETAQLPIFDMDASDSTTSSGVTQGVSLLRRRFGRLEIVWNAAQLRYSDDPRAQAAIDWLSCVIRDPMVRRKAALKPGDVLILDNRTVIHGRDTPKSEDRWFKRVFGARTGSPNVSADAGKPWLLKMDLS